MLEKLILHITNWKMVWFGFIFIGSVLNALAQRLELFNQISHLSFWCFSIGFVIGIIAKVRGKWLWN